MLGRMYSKWDTPPLLVGVQTGTDIREINMAVSQKNGNKSITRPCYTTLGHVLKGCSIIPNKGTCSNMFIAALFVITRTWKQSRCPSTEKWIKKMWCIDILEYY